MKTIEELRKGENHIVAIGNHAQIIQSILDFDYLAGKKEPSIVGIVGNEQGLVKYFWGRQDILIAQYKTISSCPRPQAVDWVLNLSSGRRVLTTGIEVLDSFPNLNGAVFFAENVPEQTSLELYNKSQEKGKLFIGPASVGIILPGIVKLGPIGGVTPEQIVTSGLLQEGGICVMSASGGMTNELISVVTSCGLRVSFALSFGGDRFPLLTPENALSLALEDPKTKAIVYYGELGGNDEYKLIEILTKTRQLANPLTRNFKPVIAHIAGTVADLFPESPQFGHAKAKADSQMERAFKKREALKKAGVTITESFGELSLVLQNIKKSIV